MKSVSKYKVSCGRKPVSQLLYRQRRRILLQLGIRKRQSEKQKDNQSSSSLHNYIDSNLTITHNSAAEDSLLSKSLNASHSVSRHKISESGDANLVLQSLVSSVCNSESQPSASSNSSVAHKEETIGFSSDDTDEESRHLFSQLLRQCFIDNNISHTTGNNILKVLRTHSCFSSLPKDSRTLLKNPRIQIELSIVEPGEYVHFGFEKGVIESLEKIQSTLIPKILEIDFNTDGGALDKSGNSQIWPIQIRIVNIHNTNPEVVGIYRGPGKPANACDFFKMFVNEVTEIIRDGGIDYKGTKLPLRLRAFIADAPARAFILNHKGHVAFHPCSKYYVKGVTIEKRTVFPFGPLRCRTDDEYSRLVDQDHHKEGINALSKLPVGAFSQVPFEYMHLICLGVVKKCISAWIDGAFTKSSKLCTRQIFQISASLNNLSQFCPREFARRPRSIESYKRFKATEFRQFLLYTGPVVLKKVLPEDHYLHFLLLHSAIRCLVLPTRNDLHLRYAELALQKFVKMCENLYRPFFLSYNVHGLLHVCDDAKNFGPLDCFSAFPYKNNMRLISRLCRKPNQPL